MKFKYALFCAVVFLIWHAVCHFYNLYFLIWWTDIVAHFIAGITAGMLWLWLIGPDFAKSSLGKQGKYIQATSIVAFSTMISVFWEYWEFSNWRYAFLRNSVGKIQQQYYPYWGNNLGDIFWGMIGGLAVAICFVTLIKRKK